MKNPSFKIILIFCIFVISLSGCDFVYRFLHKEGAEEKELLGEVIPFTHNPKVEELQELLNGWGYNAGKVDGKLGANTRSAIVRFQEDHGLKVTRFVDKKTWKKLSALKEVELISQGEINAKTLQTILKRLNLYPGNIDGKMGPQTLKALKEFQKAHGLKPDGVVGPKTINKLIECISFLSP